MRIITLNCNGLRSAAKKGFFDWLASTNADVVCLQETKAQPEDLSDALFHPAGWHVSFHSALKKGYSGVAIYSRAKPDALINSIGADEFDQEGRYLEARFGNLSVASIYVPSGSSGPERQASKDRFMEFFGPELGTRGKGDRQYVLCADWNIAHTNKDIKNWKSNQKNSGFLPHERQWMETVLTQQGWHDAYRCLYPEHEAEAYTWWSNRGNAWANNVGWRIDYQLITSGLKSSVIAAEVYKTQRFSDHAPLVVDYKI